MRISDWSSDVCSSDLHDVGSAQRVVEAFSNAGLVGAVGHIERYNPALQSARRRLENGALGSVYQIVTRRQGPFPGRIADVGVIKDQIGSASCRERGCQYV